MNELTLIESNRFGELETTIAESLQAFYEIGQALSEIRDRHLYRQTFSTFEDYCKNRWKMSRQHAYRLMEATEVVQALSPVGDKLPDSEWQMRSLTKLKSPEEQQQAWSAAVTVATNRPTSGHVEKAVAAVKNPQKFQPGDELMVEAEDSPYAGQMIEVVESDGIIIKAKTRWGEVVPLLSSEIQPEQPKPQLKPKAAPIDAFAALQSKLQAEVSRSRCLEAELENLIQLIHQGATPRDLRAAAIKAEKLICLEAA